MGDEESLEKKTTQQLCNNCKKKKTKSLGSYSNDTHETEKIDRCLGEKAKE
jgi:hypothetical protein